MIRAKLCANVNTRRYNGCRKCNRRVRDCVGGHGGECDEEDDDEDGDGMCENSDGESEVCIQRSSSILRCLQEYLRAFEEMFGWSNEFYVSLYIFKEGTWQLTCKHKLNFDGSDGDVKIECDVVYMVTSKPVGQTSTFDRELFTVEYPMKHGKILLRLDAVMTLPLQDRNPTIGDMKRICGELVDGNVNISTMSANGQRTLRNDDEEVNESTTYDIHVTQCGVSTSAKVRICMGPIAVPIQRDASLSQTISSVVSPLMGASRAGLKFGIAIVQFVYDANEWVRLSQAGLRPGGLYVVTNRMDDDDGYSMFAQKYAFHLVQQPPQRDQIAIVVNIERVVNVVGVDSRVKDLMNSYNANPSYSLMVRDKNGAHLPDDTRLKSDEVYTICQKELGGGSLGVMVHDMLRGQEVAVKKLYNHTWEREYLYENTLLASTCHFAFLSVLCHGQSNMVTKYCRHGTLTNALKVCAPSLAIRWRMCMQLIGGLVYLHDQSLVHYDIRPDSIVIDELMNAYFADMGVMGKPRRLVPVVSASDNASNSSSGSTSSSANIDQKGCVTGSRTTPSNIKTQTDINNNCSSYDCGTSIMKSMYLSMRNLSRRKSVKCPDRWITPSCDVYMFGFLLWHVFTKGKQWAVPNATVADPRAEIESSLRHHLLQEACSDAFVDCICSVVGQCVSPVNTRYTSKDVLNALFDLRRHVPDTEMEVLRYHVRASTYECVASTTKYNVETKCTVTMPDGSVRNGLSAVEEIRSFCEEDVHSRDVHSRGRCLFVSGRGGSGKSTCLQKVAAEYMHSDKCFVFLNDVVDKWSVNELRKCVDSALRRMGLTPADHILKEKSLPLVFVIDGWDDVLASDSQPMTNIKLPKWIGMNGWRNAKLIVTSREKLNVYEQKKLMGHRVCMMHIEQWNHEMAVDYFREYERCRATDDNVYNPEFLAYSMPTDLLLPSAVKMFAELRDKSAAYCGDKITRDLLCTAVFEQWVKYSEEVGALVNCQNFLRDALNFDMGGDLNYVDHMRTMFKECVQHSEGNESDDGTKHSEGNESNDDAKPRSLHQRMNDVITGIRRYFASRFNPNGPPCRRSNEHVSEDFFLNLVMASVWTWWRGAPLRMRSRHCKYDNQNFEPVYFFQSKFIRDHFGANCDKKHRTHDTTPHHPRARKKLRLEDGHLEHNAEIEKHKCHAEQLYSDTMTQQYIHTI